jgi:hypothetical protein
MKLNVVIAAFVGIVGTTLGITCARAQEAIAFASGAFTNNAVLALAGSPAEQIYGIGLGSSSTEATANGYSFVADSSANISYDVSGTYSAFLGGGGTSGDSAFDAVLNHGRVGTGNGTLTLNNLAQGVTYRVLFLSADTRSGMGTRTFSVTLGGVASNSQSYAFVEGSPSLGGYVLCTFVATGTSETFTINNAFGHQLNAILVCCAGANTPFKSIEGEWGALGGGATVVSLPEGALPSHHTETLEASGRAYVHLASTNDSVTLTNNTGITASGMTLRVCVPDAAAGGGITTTLDMYVNGTFRQSITINNSESWTYINGWDDNNPADGGIIRRYFTEVRTLITGTPIAPGSTITFEKDSGNNASYYDVDLVDLENVPAALTQPANTLSIASYGAVSGVPSYPGPTQQYAYASGSPSLGGYNLCTFTATGTTQTFAVNNSDGYQLNGLLVCSGGTPPPSPQVTTGAFTNNSVLTLAGSPSQEVYGVSLGNSKAETTSNGYGFGADTSSNTNFSYSVNGSYSSFLSGGGTSGDSAFDTVLNNGRVGNGPGLLVLNNLTQGVTYQVLFLLADTRTGGENGRTFSITASPVNALAVQNCINAAETAGKGVWIPSGTYYISQQLNASNVTISGAGVWYTTLYCQYTGAGYSAFATADCNISNLFFDSNCIARSTACGAISMSGVSGWLIDHVWVHNMQPCWLSGTNGTIQNSRSENSWADGINLNNSTNANGLGKNLTAQNNYIRGSCDDGIAVNAQNGEGASGNMVNPQVLNNTAVATTGASCISIYGGSGDIVENNLCADPTENYGLHGDTFGSGGNPLQSGLFQGNVLVRAPGFVESGALHLGSNGTATFNDNIIFNSLAAGISLASSTGTFTSNVIDQPSNQGVLIPSGQTGSAVLQNDTVINLNDGQNALENNSPSTFSITGNVTVLTQSASDLSTPNLVSVVSIQSQGGTNYALPLPLTGTEGVECRRVNGSLQLVFTFTQPVVSGDAEVTDGTGTVGDVTFSGDTMTVSLTDVTDVQDLTVAVEGINGTDASDSVTFGVLEGDVNGDGIVNATDFLLELNDSGFATGQSGFNFRADVSCDGIVNALDFLIVRNRSGFGLP